ncbi:MAG: hypothetical protein NT075_26405 [Chloroflexi bacterium]|nr:hypothetical protein [Chloroflexota bacterium]
MQQIDRWLSIVIVNILLVILAGCNPDLNATPDRALMEQAAKIAQELAAKIGYTEQNRLLEFDSCSQIGCAYQIYFTTTEDIGSFDERLRQMPSTTWVQSAYESNALDSALGDNPSFLKTYLSGDSAAQGQFLRVDGINVVQSPLALPPPIVVNWQLQFEDPTWMNPTSIQLYAIRNAKGQYTFAGKEITGNIMSVVIGHNRR